MNAVLKLFSANRWRLFAKRIATRKGSWKEDQAGRAEGCSVTAGVWESAIYLGPGGPMMRDGTVRQNELETGRGFT
ncbi:MAG: hypothetical protein DCO97_05660 [Marivita sp. XM-24bin2]|nr:MAG: hypothetical protein DCO97_05660 [Marivita sp. XM-24bin2]